MLYTLGGVRHLEEVRQPKLLVLLSYLALEGRTSRRSLAGLFWPTSPRPLSNLSVALSSLRAALPDAVVAGPQTVGTSVTTDVQTFLSALKADDEVTAAELYRGPFLLGVEKREMGSELEEWVLNHRESIADRYRSALLGWAATARDRPPDGSARTPGPTHKLAAGLADAAYRVAGAPPPDANTLLRVFDLLVADRHPSVSDVRREATQLGLSLTETGHSTHAPAPKYVAPEPSRAAPTPPALPRTAQRLIGREPERLEAHRLLVSGEARMLTLHGPGGIGKTSMALQVAHDLQSAEEPQFPGGVAFVALDGVHDAAALPFTVARALGRTSVLGRHGVDALRAVLPTKRALLVLDNLEQVTDAADMLEQALTLAPDLFVLATSRELLGNRSEVAFPLDGLRVPESTGTTGAAAFDAIRLFRQVARRADAAFEIGPDQLPSVIRICRCVGGSPLGIELAAAWVRAVPLHELADEVEADFDLLRRERQTGPDRHASARASFERSWNRLDTQHRHSLAAISVLQGRFSLADAREATRISLPQAERLVDAALLRLGSDGRYEQHPLVARFAREKLASTPVRERTVRDRHAEHFLARLASRAGQLRVLRVGVLDAIDVEFDNLKIAFAQAAVTRRAGLVEGAAFPLMRYVDARARLYEGRELFAAAAAITWPQDAPSQRANGRVLAALAWVEGQRGDHAAATTAGEQAGALLAACCDEVGARVALHALASTHYRAGAYQAALTMYEGLLAGCVDDPLYYAEILGRLGLVAQAVGEYDQARSRYLQALADNRRLANVRGVVMQLLNLGALELNTDAPQAAGERFDEALLLARDHGYYQVIPMLLHNLANVSCKARNFAEARRLGREALEMVVASGERGLESGMRATLGWIELEGGDLAKAETYVRQAVTIATDIGDEPAQQTANVRLGQVLLAHGRSEEAAFLFDFAADHVATLTWARRLALRLRQHVPL